MTDYSIKGISVGAPLLLSLSRKELRAMSVNGVGYYGNYYGVNNISSLYRHQIQNASQKVSRVSDSSYSNLRRYVEKSSAGFLKSYNSSMASLMTSANALKSTNKSSVWNKLSASSSDTKIIEVKQNYSMNSKDTYDVSVKQLAQTQKNISQQVDKNSYASSDAAVSISNAYGDFTFQVSHKDENGRLKTNGQILDEIASVVNQSGIGIQAEVLTKDGQAQLSLVSKETGEENAFRVTGDFAEKSGLTNISRLAQDAVYTVSKNGHEGKEYTASSNTVSIDYGRVDATLKSEGNSTIGVGVNKDQVVSAVKDLVKNYNSTVQMLGRNADRGYGVEKQLNNMLNLPLSEKSLALTGITRNKDGLLELDEEKLRSSLEENPSLVKEVIGGSFSLSQTLFEDGRKGLSQSGASLIENDLGIAEQRETADLFSLLNRYSRSGAYAVSNFYTVGNLINMLV